MLNRVAVRTPRGARGFFDEITADIAARVRKMRRGRTVNVLRRLEPARLLPAHTLPRDEPNLARALHVVQAHAPAHGDWTAAALRAAAVHAASALDDAHAAATPAEGLVLLADMQVPPPDPDGLPDLTPVPADLAPPLLTFDAAAEALAPLARVLAVQSALRQLDALLGGPGASAAAALPAARTSPDALARALSALAFGGHDERLREWMSLFRLGSAQAAAAAAASAPPGAAEPAPADGGAQAAGAAAAGPAPGAGGAAPSTAEEEPALTVEEAATMTRLLELSARPAAVALLGALGGGFGTAPRPRARAPAAPTAKDGTPAVAGKEAGKEETSSDLLHDDEQQWAERWLALTAAQLAPAPPARRRFPRVPLLPRRPPPAERALLAHLKGLAAISPAAGMVSAQALATSPPTRLASGAALLENAASSFHSFADEQRALVESRRDRRFYAAAFAATVVLDITLSYI